MSLRYVRRIPEWKLREVEELASLIRKYRVIGVASLEGLPTSQLQKIRKKLRGKAVLRVAKNTLFKIALEKAGVRNREELAKYLKGSNLFVFTNMSAFELALLLEKEKTSMPAKPGMVATSEIVVPAGDTGLTPGPILSTFGKLRIPTRVQDGTIWVAKDTVVARPGDEISPELASLLQKLGIEPFEVGISLKVAFDDGLVIPGDELKLDLEEYKSKLAKAHAEALQIASEIALPVPEALELSLVKAAARALALASEAGFVTPETAEAVLARAHARALALVAALGDVAKELGVELAAPSAPAAEEKEEGEKKEEEKEEKREEEELEAGLSALFG